MKILHSKLKDKILQILAYHACSFEGKTGNAEKGVIDLFEYIKDQITEEIYVLYLTRCQKDFFNGYRFELEQPYVRGMMEARYYIIRMFNISYAEYFDVLKNISRSTGNCEEKSQKISA